MVRPVGSVTKSSTPDMRQDSPSAAGAGRKTALANAQANPKADALKQRSPDDETAFQGQVFSMRRKQHNNGSDRPEVLRDARTALQSVKSADLSRMDPNERANLEVIKKRIDIDRLPPDGRLNPGESARVTEDYVHRYLDGRMNNGSVSPSQRLANMMTVLGPARMYVVLARMHLVESPEIQSSLAALVINKQFSADDAMALARAQAEMTPSGPYSPGLVSPLGRLMKSLPNDENGTAVKAGYAWGCVAGAHGLAQLSPQDWRTVNLNDLCQNATSIGAGLPDPFKEKVFSQLRSVASEQPLSGDVLNSYAAGFLGSLNEKAQVVKTLRAMGGVGAKGAIDPNSELSRFLQSALRGQSQFGIASPSSPMTPSGEMPRGVTSLLNAIADSGDTKLMAGTLDIVMQWTIMNPTQAAVLASQDTGSGTTEYRNALTNLLDKSFNQFVALNPSDRDKPIAGTMHPLTIVDLQALSAIEMGPPYDSRIAGHFADVVGKHAVQFALVAVNAAKYPELDRLLPGGADRRKSAALIFGELMSGFAEGLNQSQASFRRNAPRDARLVAAQKEMQTRVMWDLARSFGTGTLLASAWISPAGISIPIGFGAKAGWEKLASIFGRIGLFSGSVGTAKLDIANASQEAEAQGLAYARELIREAGGPTKLLQQTYFGWFSNRKLPPGTPGQEILIGALIGSSFAGAPMIKMDIQNFYDEYDPFGYYLGKTHGFPPIK